jgi:hypothetical protein
MALSAICLTECQEKFCAAVIQLADSLALQPASEVGAESEEDQLLACFDGCSMAVGSLLRRLYENFTVFAIDHSDYRGLNIVVVCTFLREYGFNVGEMTARELGSLEFDSLSFPWLLRVLAWIIGMRPGELDARYTTSGPISADALRLLLPVEIDVPISHIPELDVREFTVDALVVFLDRIRYQSDTGPVYSFTEAKGPFPARGFSGSSKFPQSMDLDNQIRFCFCTRCSCFCARLT